MPGSQWLKTVLPLKKSAKEGKEKKKKGDNASNVHFLIMWLHMVNGQCFRCLNIFQPALRHEIVIIQFANTFPGCQSHFATRKQKDWKKKKKKAQHKKHELLFTGKGTESGNLLHVTGNISKSLWQLLQTFNCCTQNLFGVLLTEAQRWWEMFKGTTEWCWGLSSHPPHMRAEENLLRAIWLCASWLVILLI